MNPYLKSPSFTDRRIAFSDSPAANRVNYSGDTRGKTAFVNVVSLTLPRLGRGAA